MLLAKMWIFFLIKICDIHSHTSRFPCNHFNMYDILYRNTGQVETLKVLREVDEFIFDS